MKSLKRLVRNFMQLSTEDKAFRLVAVGFLGIVIGLVANVLGYAYENLWGNLLLGVFALVFAFGCILVCKTAGRTREPGAKPMVYGAFGISAYMTIMCCIGWCVKYIWNVDILSDVLGVMTLYAVISSVLALSFFVGLVILIANAGYGRCRC